MRLNIFHAIVGAVASMALVACDRDLLQTDKQNAGAALDVGVYERAEAFLPENLGELAKGERLVANWRDDSAQFWFEADTAQGYRYVLIDPDENSRRELIDPAVLSTKLAEETGEAVDPSTLRLDSFEFDFEAETASFRVSDRNWAYDPATDALTEITDEAEDIPGLSPDGRWRAFVEDHNLHIEEVESGAVRSLTTDGTALRPYARPVVALRRMIDQGTSTPDLDPDIYWAPDSTRFVTYRMNLEGARRLSVVQSTPPEGAPPIAYDYVYPLTGDENVPTAESFVFDAASGAGVAVDLPPQEILYYYGPYYVWMGDSAEFLQVYPDRAYHALTLYATDAKSGRTRVLTENRSDEFVDYYAHNWEHLEDSGSVFWLSEETGWHHGYLIGRDGSKTALTSGDWRARYLAGTDPAEETFFIVGAGREPDRDPYLRHLYRVRKDGGDFHLLTPEPVDHDVSVSPDGRFFVDNMSTVNQPTRSVLRRADDGAIVMELQAADISGLEDMGYAPPEPFETVAADGQTLIYGAIYRPSNFDPSKTYPVIENIYTGPHYVMTPKSFTAGLTRRNAASIAELGFIVVTIDGRGTSGRSRAFLAHAYKNLHNVGLDDHVAGMRAMAEKYPYMDLSRVGVYGFSAGGYDVLRAMTRRPDFYKAGVSASGNHDNRLDKAIWNEQWMGFPLDEHYDENSNVVWAEKLEGDLFLAHGELDENVPPLATRRLIDALIEANKDFEYLIVPGAGHFLDDYPYFNRRRWDFFVRSLQGVEPPQAYKIDDGEEPS